MPRVDSHHTTQTPQRFRVKLALHIIGPVRPRTKHKENTLLYAEGCITLPFVPYPGLGLTLKQTKPKGGDRDLYLRIRTVEWVMPAEEFECTADEVLTDPSFAERCEVRGCAKTEEQYVRMQKTLQGFGFELTLDAAAFNRITQFADGIWKDPEEKAESERRYVELLHSAREQKRESKAKSSPLRPHAPET